MKKVISLALALMVMLAICLSGTTIAAGSEKSHPDEFDIGGPTRIMSCLKCGWITEDLCTRDQVFSHTSTHKTGFLGIGGDVCTVSWHRSVIVEKCSACGHIESITYGHYCLQEHSVCGDTDYCHRPVLY